SLLDGLVRVQPDRICSLSGMAAGDVNWFGSLRWRRFRDFIAQSQNPTHPKIIRPPKSGLYKQPADGASPWLGRLSPHKQTQVVDQIRFPSEAFRRYTSGA